MAQKPKAIHQGKRPPSSTEVARRAGVSQSAVSRTFTGASVSPQTRAKVLEAAAELGYVPAKLPSILQKGRSSIVAIVAGGLYNPYFTTMLDALATSLQAQGNQIMLVRSTSDTDLDEVVEELAGYRVDAVVSALSIKSEKVASALGRFRIPIVSLNSGIASGYVRSVSTDNRGAAIEAAKLFKQQGRSRLAYLAGTDSTPQSSRQAGFVSEAMRKRWLEPIIKVAGYDYDSGFRAALSLFDDDDRPDAIFCVDDLVALGAIDAVRTRLGLRVPEDVAVIGFDDIPMASWAAYELTTFRQDIPGLIRGVNSMLCEEVGAASLVLAPTLVRRSTA